MGISRSLRFVVLNRDGFRCRYCGDEPSHKKLEVDHIVPRSKGGSDIIENLVTACFDCNRGKSNKEIVAIDKSLTLANIENKALVAFNKKRLEDEVVSFYTDYFLDNAPHFHELNNYEKRIFRDISKQFEPDIIFESIDVAIDKYIPDIASDKDYYFAIKKISGIAFNKSKRENNG